MRRILIVLSLTAPVLLLLVACADGDAELSRGQAEELDRLETADTPQPESSPTVAEAEPTASGEVASIPPKWAPTEYTRFFVQNAINQYETLGIEAVLAYYNSTQSIDGQWYIFIIDENDLVIGDPDPGRVGLDMKGSAGTDVNGYNFGPELLSATEDGKWVSYVYRNPESGDIASGDFGELELKNVWVVRHDGLLFASGWYIGADEFARRLVTIALSEYQSGGLEATLAYFAEPESALAGLDTAIAYYNQAETVDGKWSAFIADANGKIVAHSDPAMIGNDLRELFGTGAIEATEGGNWVTTDAVRMWVAEADGFVFGSGWHHDEPGSILVDVTASKVPLPINMEELLDRVDIIAVGRVGPVSREAEEDGFDRTGPGLTPHTYFELNIEQVIRDDGAIARGETILLRAIGRTHNWPEDRSVEGIIKVYHDVDPLPVTGERRLFLLSRTANGSYMSGGPSGLLIIDGDIVKFATEDLKPVPFATGKTPEEFLTELTGTATAGQ